MSTVEVREPAPFDARYLRFTGVVTLVVALVAIAGWVGDWRVLSNWVPGGSLMVFNTAVCLAGCAVALLLLGQGRTRLAAVLGLLSGIFAAIVLSQYSLDRSWGVDELFWRHAPTLGPLSTPGRMAPNTAAALVLIGLAVALMAVRPDRRVWLMIAGVGVLTLAALPILSYFAALQTGSTSYRGMSLPTLVCVLLFGVTILRHAGSAVAGRERHFPPAMAAAVSLLMAVGLVSTQSNAELVESSRRVVRSHETQAGIERVVARVARMETNARGYALSGGETMRVASVNHARELLRLLAVLDGLVADDTVQRPRAVELRRRAVEKIIHNDLVLAARQRTGGVEEPARIVFAPSAATANGMISLGNEMKTHENRLLARWEAEMAHLATNTRTTQIFGSLVALALVGLTVVQTRRAAIARRAAEADTRTANAALSQRVAELAAARVEIESANRLQRAVLDGTVQSVISTTPEGIITSFNAGAEKMLGYRRDEMVGRATLALIHVPEEIAARAAELGVQLNHPVPADFEAFVAWARLGRADEREWTLVRKDGSRLPVLLTITALRDEAGGITGFLGIAQDLTDRKQAELALKSTEERLGQVLSHAECLVWEARVQLLENDWKWRVTVYPSGLYHRLTGEEKPPPEAWPWYRFEVPEQAEMDQRARVAMGQGSPGYVQEFRLQRDRATTWVRESVAIVPLGLGQFWLIGVATDITEEKRADAARTEVLGRLEKIGHQIPGMIYQFRLRPDGTSCFPYASEGIRQIYRVAPEEVREDAAKVTAALHPDDAATVRHSIEESARTLGPWRLEYRVRYADGVERWLFGSSVPEREADGSVLWHGFITDVTERRRVERALADQERRLRLVLEQLPVGVRWVRQIDGRREAVINPAHERITGVPLVDEGVPGIYLSRTHPDDLPRQEAGLARLHRGEIEQFSMEKRYVKPGGEVTWVLITWLRRRLPGEGNFEELATVKDITERKQDEAALRTSEERMRLFVAHAPSSVAMFDRDMRYVVVSREWMEAYQLAGDVLGKSHYEIFPEIGEEWKAVHRRCLAGAVERREADLFVRADGTRQWLRWEVRPWFDAAGAIGGIMMFTVDLTERKKLEENLALVRDAALEASRLKSEFLATISHEIRTPMNAVIGMAGLLAETPLNAEQEEMARTILGGAENLLAIINDILDFSRIEAGRLRLDPVEFDFGRMVGDTVALLAQRAREKGLKLACEFESMPATLLLGDAGRVRQVLTNLLGNAIKFTDAGGVTIRTRMVAEAAGRTRMRVAVQDTGIGIAPEARRLLFQPFTQVDGSPTRRFGGTGLGLAICRQLVGLMDGEIGCESEPGSGSVFWFEVVFASRGPLGAEPAGGGFSTPVATGGGQRLLLVEDNPANQRVAVLLLAKMGYDVVVAANGQAALGELAARRFDGVLMDCQMPVLDGYAATRQIRSGGLAGVDARIPIVALTAYARAEDRARCLEAGMNDHVTKPIRPTELRTVLARCGLAPGEAAALAPGRREGGGVFDAEALAAARGLPGNAGPSLLPELVRLYLSDEAARLAQLDRLAAARQAELLADEVHSFGGNAASFGGLEVRRVALALEEVARAADWGEVTVQRQRLHEACARLRSEIARLNLTAG